MMIRISLATAAIIFGMIGALASHPAEAREAPWCAVQPMGPDGGLIEDCRFWTLEQCIPEVIAGNRGTCGQNPRWQGPWPPEQYRSQRRNRRR